ncbi:MAG: carbohydrate ABC transporter permease [Defluviitaleaceae bacterium]|nr:carbohydrate ABC transporter permease [Defluviitaleaceae bacterium]MCL2837303.1 carbohydrate ABC transporter permease [Defluviitaleaceae bacterium]
MSRTTARRVKLTVCYILVAIMCVVFLLPFYWMIRSALMDMRQLFAWPIMFFPNPIRWENIPNALRSQPFPLYFRNTIFLVIVNMAGVLVTSSMAGYAFSRLKWRGKKVFFYALLSTMMIPSFITLIPTFLIWSRFGLVNTYWPLVMPSWLGGTAFNIFLSRQFFMTIPYDLDEAALLDGASQWKIFWRIHMPLIKPVLAVLGIFTFMNTWNDLLNPVIYLNSPRRYTLSIALASFRGTYEAKWDFLMAASAIVTMPVIIVFFIFQRYFIEGITLTGIKG